jgi:cyanuric acid amidohydrolase
MPTARVHRISATAPDDVSGIDAAIKANAIDPHAVIAVLGKTEGNGCVNDFTRGYATLALSQFFARYMPKEQTDQICFVMSGGTEGGMAPHWTVFERVEGGGGASPALAVGRAHMPALPPEHLGRAGQIDAVTEGVAAAMKDALIGNPADVHFVQIKCPLLTAQKVQEAVARGHTTATQDTLKSMGLSRAASALGVAVALGEVGRASIRDEDIGSQWSLWSGRASCSAGIELAGHEIVVLGMSRQWSGDLAVDHAVMTDAIDIEPVRGAMERLGLGLAGQMSDVTRSRVVALLAKAEPSHSGVLRGYRHTMLDDSDISSTRHARAFVCGALAGLIGHAEIYVSGGAEHQGPDGGGPVAIVARK